MYRQSMVFRSQLSQPTEETGSGLSQGKGGRGFIEDQDPRRLGEGLREPERAADGRSRGRASWHQVRHRYRILRESRAASARSLGTSMKPKRPGSRLRNRFSATVISGTTASSCGMMTISASSASPTPRNWRTDPSSRSSPSYSPYGMTPARMRINVDLPAPFSPTTATISPLSACSETSRRTVTPA